MKYSLIFSLLLFYCIPKVGCSQTSTVNTGSKFSNAEVQQFLDHHNQARSELNVSPLKWSESIATYAQEWADYLANKKKCKMIHRYELKQNEAGYGENLYWGSSSTIFTPIDASNAWYSEKEYFKNGSVTYRGVAKSGHYSQMIWGSTTEVGAGKAICPSGAIIIVANYNPAGNIIGSHP